MRFVFLTPAAAAWAGAFLFWPSPAHAYIDAHTGSLLLQSLIAGFLGAAFTLRKRLGRLVSWLKRKGADRPPQS